ncbi:MAG: tRNA 2-selenouridine(34) synthase MnmH [Desulfovibrio sp.]|jgi:tRNA 2-selenouridine synthase|nr:tRNA 2-selenouridine(34) synthase MnmH [Desulfovibrio sp.]
MSGASGVRRLCVEEFLAVCAAGRALSDGVPLADVRSPLEFAGGHIPGAVNIPLFSDAERAEVGELYARKGREEAVMRGLGHVGPRLAALAEAGRALCRRRAAGEIALYCSRGGMRSAAVGWLLSSTGLCVHVLDLGYKSFRRHALAVFERPVNLRVLGGKTGVGKTMVLERMAARGAQVVDLENLARHRGSAFGALAGTTQPSREQFENTLALALAAKDSRLPVWVEDECENLGGVNLPRPFFLHLRASPMVILESSDAARLARVLQDYGDLPREDIRRGLERIKKRLGGLEHRRALASLEEGDLPHLAGILLGYYDRAYARQVLNRPPAARVYENDPDAAAERLLTLEL